MLVGELTLRMPDIDPHSPRNTLIGMGFVLATLFCWSVTPVFVEYFTEKVDPWTSNGWRYGFAALLWLPVLVVAAVRKKLPAGLFRKALVPGLINAAGQIVFVLAFYNTTAPMVAIGLRSQIIVVSLGAAVFFAAERKVVAQPMYIVAITMIVGGLIGAVLLGGDAAFVEIDGFLLALGAGAGYGFYALAVRHWMQGVNPLLAFAAISQYTAAIMVTLMLFRAEDFGARALDLEPATFGLFLLSAVIGIAIGHVVYYIAINRLGVAVASGVVQTQPVWVALVSWAFLDQPGLTATQWIGGAVAILGAIVLLWVQHKTRQRAVAEARAQRALAAANLCSECGHELGKLTEGICPECGQTIGHSESNG